MASSNQIPNPEFYMYVGLCITAWARVDEELFKTCDAILGTKKELAAIIYYRTTTLGARLALVGELVHRVLPKRERKSGGHDHPDVKTWRELQTDIEALLQERTQIAHHPVEMRFRDISRTQISTSYRLYVSDAERLRGRHDNTAPLTVDRLSEHCQIVQQRARVLRKFRQNVLQGYLK
jgi:hypothetical protein